MLLERLSKSMLSVVILALLIQGCSTTKYVPQIVYKVPKLPPAWMTECRDLDEYASGDIEQILLTHGHNMEAAGICKQRHAAMIAFLSKLMEAEQ